MYTKVDFGRELEMKLDEGLTIKKLADWAHEVYLDKCDGYEEKGLDRVMLKIMTMGEGKEFEYSLDELYQMVKELQSQGSQISK